MPSCYMLAYSLGGKNAERGVHFFVGSLGPDSASLPFVYGGLRLVDTRFLRVMLDQNSVSRTK
jgi:hypothetical protein